MATLRDLVSAECGGANPLMRLASHYGKDQGQLPNGLVRPGLLPGRPEPLGAAAAAAGPAHRGAEDQVLVQEFLNETRLSLQRPPPQTFRMDSLMRDMRDIERSHIGMSVPKMAPNVAALAAKSDDAWTSDFLSQAAPLPAPSASTAEKTIEKNVIDWSHDFLQSHPNINGPDNPLLVNEPKQTPYDAKWAEEYLSEVPELKLEKEDPLAEVAEEVFRSAHKQTAKDAKGTTEWAEEFAEFTEADGLGQAQPPNNVYKEDFWKKLENEWKDLATGTEHPWLSEFSESFEPDSYHFHDENPLKDHPQALEEGKAKLTQGDIPSAVLLFEAAVQQTPSNGEAWTLLGTTQAKNEQDPSAIAALKEAVKLEPGNTQALMALAVSLTNESYQAQACKTLQDWIHANPKYGQQATRRRSDPESVSSSFMSQELHEQTSELFLSAARRESLSSEGAATVAVDADVQCGLGILFNLSGDYDKAVDCFRAALQVRPDDALLWNKLGATLANGNRSEEAVTAYHHALQLSPGFIRCRYNLGISCVNLKAYREAAEHFLTGLNFQAAGRGPQGQQSKNVMSDNIWSSLRFCISLLDLKDRLPDVDGRRLDRLSSLFNVQPVESLAEDAQK